MSDHSVTYGVIDVRGEDATGFLNAQLSRQVDDMAAGETRLAAWCTAKGRVLALFRVTPATDGYQLALPSGLVSKILPRLQMFVLRSRVKLGQSTRTPDAAPSRLEEIRKGIPEIYPETCEQFLPQMLNLDTLGVIDFKKGCYPGQEVVARSQYRGQVKRRLFLFSAIGGNPPAPGAELGSSEGQSGTIVDAVTDHDGQRLIQAVIPIDAAQLSWQIAETQGQLTLQA